MTFYSTLAVGALAFTILSAAANAAAPAWWAARGAIDPLKTPEDFAPVTLGQLKWMATKAKEELDSFVPGGAGTTVNALVDSWSTLQPGGSRVPVVTTSTSDYAPANLGQIKAVAKLFYDRLITAGLAAGYPWTGTTADDDDYAIANLGQLKNAFNFDRDMDDDGLTDSWELQFSASLATLSGLGGADSDGDGVSNLSEFQANTDPTKSAPALALLAPSGATLTP